MWGSILGTVGGFALGGGPGAAIGGTIGAGIDSQNAAKEAAEQQMRAAELSSATQERMFDKQTALQAPFRGAGVDSLNKLRELLGLGGDQNAQGYGSLMRDFTMGDFQADPGYQFRQQEGMKGIEGGAAARGGLLSGAALKAIQKYGQDLASQEYGNAYGRFTGNQTNKYNKLAGLVNTGQGATNVLTNAAGTLGQNVGQNIIGAGNAQAAGTVGQANAWNSAIGQGVNMWQQNQLMDMIRRPGSSNDGGFGNWLKYGSSGD